MRAEQFNAAGRVRRSGQGEARFPPALAVCVAVLTYALLPQSLLVGPRFVIPIIEGFLLLALVAVNPVRMNRQTRWSRRASIGLSGVVIVTNFVALGMLVSSLNAKTQDPQGLLLGGVQVWVTNVIGFGLLYWELDRGGRSPDTGSAATGCRSRTGASRRTRTTTPSSRWLPPRASAPGGSLPSSTTSTCR